MAETMRKRRNKWDVASEPQNPIEHDGAPIKSNNSAEGDVFTSEMKSADNGPTTINGGSYGSDNDIAMMENTSTFSLPSKMETDPSVLSSTKIEADKFVEYSQMKDEDLNCTEGSTDNINLKREGSDVSPKKHHNNRTVSPGHDPWRQTSPAMPSWGKSKRRSRSRSRSWSRSRSRSRSRGRSRSRSPINNHRWRSLRSRSRSRSPYHRSRRDADDSADRGKRGICRDFAVGRCRRGVDCRFIHDDTARRPYNRYHDVGERKFEKEDARVSREPLENTHRDERGYPRYSREPVENIRRNERGSLQNSREPTEITQRNERENFRDLGEPIDNIHRNERENFHDSREPIDNTWRNEREIRGDSREPIENTRRIERGSLQNSREPTESTRRNEREHFRDLREPIDNKHRNERENFHDSREPIDGTQRNGSENFSDSREPIDNPWRNERENLGDSREPIENTRRNERDDLRDSRDRFSRNDSRPPAACYDFSKGRCQRGSECRYAHHDSSFDNGRSYSSSRDEYRTRTQRVVRDTVCKFFADGCCKRGQSCSFSHVILGPRDGNNGSRSKVDEDNMYRNHHRNENQIQNQQHQTQNQHQNQNLIINQHQNQNQPQNVINPLPFPLAPPNIQMPQLVPPMPVEEQMPPNIIMPQLVPPMPVDEQMQQAILSMIQNGQNQFVPQPNSNFNMPVQNLSVVPPQNFNLIPSNNTVGQQILPTLPFTAPNFVGPTLQNIPFNDNVLPAQPTNPENQPINSEIQSLQIGNDITQKVVTSEQAAQITNISASLARFFGNAPLNPQIVTGSGLVVPPNQDPVTETETKKITEVEVQEGVKEIGTVNEKKNGEGVESKQTKDGKGMKMFKCAIVDFVKDALKPNWKEGQLSREAHKTIVKKVVEKVTGAMQSQNIPQTQEKIDAYMAHSKAKLSKLVQAYVEKYVKG